MNFLGHAAVARFWSREPAVLLGAMLPDFVAMIGAQPPRLEPGGLARGVALHHATDHAFHRHPAFRALMREGAAELAARSVRRGTALAVAHVGVELVIDGVLARDAELAADYVASLAAGDPDALGASVTFATLADHEHYAQLHAALTARAASIADATPARLTERLVYALASRARLAVAPTDRAAVTDFIAGVLAPVESALPELLVDLRRLLAREAAAATASTVSP